MMRGGLIFLLLLSAVLVHHSQADGMRQFKPVLTPKTWTEAQSDCRDRFTDFATIQDDTENQEVMALVNGVVWIGLNRGWKWSPGNHDLTENAFTSWSKNEPGSGDCVTVGLQGWSAKDCNTKNHVLCYNAKTQKHVLLNQPMTWSEAQSLCSTSNSRLSSILSQREAEEIRQLLQGTAGSKEGTTSTEDTIKTEGTTSTEGTTKTEGTTGTGGTKRTIGIKKTEGNTETVPHESTIIGPKSKPLGLNDVSITAWVGLRRGEWAWSDQSHTPYRKWMPGQPVGGADCVVMETKTGTWRSAACSETYSFICYSAGKHSILTSLKFRLTGGPADLDDPQLQLTVLQQLEQKLQEGGVEGQVKLRWRKRPDGKVFHREEEQRAPSCGQKGDCICDRSGH